MVIVQLGSIFVMAASHNWLWIDRIVGSRPLKHNRKSIRPLLLMTDGSLFGIPEV